MENTDVNLKRYRTYFVFISHTNQKKESHSRFSWNSVSVQKDSFPDIGSTCLWIKGEVKGEII